MIENIQYRMIQRNRVEVQCITQETKFYGELNFSDVFIDLNIQIFNQMLNLFSHLILQLAIFFFQFICHFFLCFDIIFKRRLHKTQIINNNYCECNRANSKNNIY